MSDTLGWSIRGKSFQDGSFLESWIPVYESDEWHWQYDTHELSFKIYKHDGEYWKLYHARFSDHDGNYAYDFGGQACRMVLVAYTQKARSPHSKMPKDQGEQEWIRTYEYRSGIHSVIKHGENYAKYGEPYTDTLR